jgi:hypothetical protein
LKQKHRIDRNRLLIDYDQQLGHGAFAMVYKGILEREDH